MRITNTKSSTVSLVVLDQVPQPEDERLKVSILVPKGLKNVDDVVKQGVGTDGKPPLGTNKKLPPSPGSAAKLEDIPETTGVQSKASVFRRNSAISKSSATAAVATASAVATTSSAPSSAPMSGWGTAKATLKKNGEIRWDVDLLRGGCVALALEWECRMPSGDGVYALS
jgi:hypothetical protein